MESSLAGRFVVAGFTRVDIITLRGRALSDASTGLVRTVCRALGRVGTAAEEASAAAAGVTFAFAGLGAPPARALRVGGRRAPVLCLARPLVRCWIGLNAAFSGDGRSSNPVGSSCGIYGRSDMASRREHIGFNPKTARLVLATFASPARRGPNARSRQARPTSNPHPEAPHHILLLCLGEGHVAVAFPKRLQVLFLHADFLQEFLLVRPRPRRRLRVRPGPHCCLGVEVK